MMNCPLFVISEMISAAMTQSKYDIDNTTCDEEACAWYDDENECCAMLSLAQSRGKDGGEA